MMDRDLWMESLKCVNIGTRMIIKTNQPLFIEFEGGAMNILVTEAM